jgi:CheY-like chemotaxis protein
MRSPVPKGDAPRNPVRAAVPRILIADDDRTLGRALAFAVRDLLGMEATVVLDAYEASQQLATAHFDAVVTDIFMPGDGRTVLRKVRETCPDTPVIVMTAMTDRYGRDEALALGAFEFLAKPFSAEDLGRVLQRALPDGALPPRAR